MHRIFPQTTRILILAGLIGTVVLFVAWSEGHLPQAKARNYHTSEDIANFRGGGLDLATGYNNFFVASGQCYGCHGPDELNNLASVDAQGNDINVMDDWRSSMMANSARDPFWRAKVSHEVAVNPDHQELLEDKCTSCHAPMGHYDKKLTTGLHYSIAEMLQDPLALDGVSCASCHMQSADSLGLLFSGELRFDTSGVLYGPYGDTFGSPMTAFVGYEPIFGAHINDAGLCAGCHTLITGTVDLQGNPTGDEFVEQATYHEWVNSVYDTGSNPDGGVSCQACHLPRIDDAVVISANYIFLEPRTPFGLHEMVGANSFMLELMKNNSAELELTASTVQFDSTIARTNRMLQQNTLLLETSVTERDLDTAFIAVKLINLAGHKFPSGYPARRAFVELLVLKADEDTVFRSGGWNSEFEVIGHDADWEPHYDIIRQPDQAQIYEMVMGDVNGDKTTVLERAMFPLKDNRLTPLGFTTTHPSYDTTLIAGVPPSDTNFNRDAMGVEGSGTDIINYHVAMDGYDGLIRIKARVWYQSSPPRWMEEMFAYNTPEIDQFRDMFEAADNTPILVKEMEITDLTVAIDDIHELGIRIFPNPVRDGVLRIEGLGARVTGVEVFDLRGALVATWSPNGKREWQVRLPSTSATYVVVVRTPERNFVQRVVAF
jgi:hypothetical protein